MWVCMRLGVGVGVRGVCGVRLVCGMRLGVELVCVYMCVWDNVFVWA